MSIKATVNPAADTAEITKEELIADAREHETSLLDGLLTAAGFKTAEDCIKKVVISRGGKDLFSFHIHPLSEKITTPAARSLPSTLRARYRAASACRRKCTR